MKQYQLNNNELILKVKKSPFLVRFIMFIFSFVFFLAPLSGMIFSILLGKGFHFGFFIGIGIFGLLGFYMLRISLWNTYGFEKIIFNKKHVTYLANYKWFKDSEKTKEIEPLLFSITSIGYEEDNEGVLKIGFDNSSIECATKMPIPEIKKLIEELERSLKL